MTTIFTPTIKNIDDLVLSNERTYKEENINKMSFSLKTTGRIEDVVIDNYNNVLSGGLRVIAELRNGTKVIPCKVFSGTPEEARQIMIDSNLVRQSLSAAEKGKLQTEKKKYLQSLGVKNSAQVVADSLGVSKSSIFKTEKLIDTLAEEGLVGLIIDVEHNSEDHFSETELKKYAKSEAVKEGFKSGKYKTTNDVREDYSSEQQHILSGFYNEENLISFYENKLEELKKSFQKSDKKKIDSILKSIENFTSTQTTSK